MNRLHKTLPLTTPCVNKVQSSAKTGKMWRISLFSAKIYKAKLSQSKRTFHGYKVTARYNLEDNLSIIIIDEPFKRLKDQILQFIVLNSFTFA